MKGLLIVSILTMAITAVCAELTAKIESCSGCSLNKLPRLKQFLKGSDGAITYRNVEIEFIRGRKATMSIMEDGVEIENITLSDYESEGEEAMHALFKEKGFEQLSPAEIEMKFAEISEKEEAKREEAIKKREEMRKKNEAKRESTLAAERDQALKKREEMRQKHGARKEATIAAKRDQALKKREEIRKRNEAKRSAEL